MKHLHKFIPLAKMEEQENGTLLVFGTVTAEQPDLEHEVCDYETTKAYYLQARDANLQKTSLPGMTPSMMPFREMHQAKTQGAGRSMVFDDATKTIKMGFEVVAPDAIKMWKAGCFVGFSQGGSYIKQWPDPEFDGCTRYTADPIEVSAVDSPCLPSALVESMKGKTVTLMKGTESEQVPLKFASSDETRMIRAEREIEILKQLLKEKKTKTVDGVALTASCFAHVGDPDDPETWKLPIKFPDEEKTKSHIRNALARFEQTEGMSDSEKKSARAKIMAAAKEHGIETSEADKAAIVRACAKISLEKGMYEVGWMAQLVEELHWLCMQTEFERDIEDDGSKVPDALRASWLKLIATFKDMAVEEADELAAQGGQGDAMKITTQEQLTKAAKTMVDHMEKHMEMHKAHHEKLEGVLSKDHPIMKSSQSMMDHCEKCMKAAKDSMGGEEPEEGEKLAPTGDAKKLADLQEQVAALVKSNGDLAEAVKKLPANGTLAKTGATETAKETGFEELLVAK